MLITGVGSISLARGRAYISVMVSAGRTKALLRSLTGALPSSAGSASSSRENRVSSRSFSKGRSTSGMYPVTRKVCLVCPSSPMIRYFSALTV